MNKCFHFVVLLLLYGPLLFAKEWPEIFQMIDNNYPTVDSISTEKLLKRGYKNVYNL